MIDVVFDHQIFVTQRYGGISRYFFELARALPEVGDVHPTIIAPFHVNEYLHGRPAGMLSRPYCPHPARGLRHRVRALAPLVSLLTRARAPRIMHETYYDGIGLRISGMRTVATLHDMTFERFPELFDNAVERTSNKLAALRRADRVICASEHSRCDLLERFPEFTDRCVVVHHGVTQPIGSTDDTDLPQPYLLFVGTRGGYKNFALFAQAFGASPWLRENFYLVLFGGGALTTAERAMLAEAGVKADRVIQRHGDDATLQAAYRGAAALVFPSLYEGFGMPLLEAMVNGCPVLCSHASCFPEVAGDAAIYFNAEDIESTRHVLETALSDKNALSTLVERGTQRARGYSWFDCAAHTAAVYRELA